MMKVVTFAFEGERGVVAGLPQSQEQLEHLHVVVEHRAVSRVLVEGVLGLVE